MLGKIFFSTTRETRSSIKKHLTGVKWVSAEFPSYFFLGLSKQSDVIEAEGIVEECLPNAMFRVRLIEGPFPKIIRFSLMPEGDLKILHSCHCRRWSNGWNFSVRSYKGRIVFRKSVSSSSSKKSWRYVLLLKKKYVTKCKVIIL